MADELRNSAFSFLRSSSAMLPQERMLWLQSFLDAFRRSGDIESQLVIRYEMLLQKEATFTRHMDVDDWISFAEDCLASGFLNNAVKAYDRVVKYIRISQPDRQSKKSTCCDAGKSRKSGNGIMNPSSHLKPQKTAASQFMTGIRKKENAKLQIIRGKRK